MIKSVTISKQQPFPMVLRYTDVRSYLLTGLFVLLSVMVPWVFHQFHLAGPTFLPMHIFVLMAGLLFGWRAGLIVGLFTPIASYAVSGMPALTILPQVIIELAAYGSMAGILRQIYNLRTEWSLLGAMIGGRIASLLTILAIYFLAGQSYSPLGLESNPFAAFWSTVSQGWPGILIQLAFIPAVVWMTGKFAARSAKGRPA